MDNRQRRDLGLPYIADESVMEEQRITRRIIHEFNTMDAGDFDGLRNTIGKLIQGDKTNLNIVPPFHCDYGTHIHVGKNFFANYNCTILDVAKVEIGDNVLFAPNVAIYTAGHPIHPVARNSGYEYGIPVKIGNNVWVGGSVVINPGVTIGDNVVIGSGSVVTKDIPDNSIAVGNPCRVIREVTEEDMKYYYRDKEFDEEAMKKIKSI